VCDAGRLIVTAEGRGRRLAATNNGDGALGAPAAALGCAPVTAGDFPVLHRPQ